jgi:Na+(H+)/acetate symporter ActP
MAKIPMQFFILFIGAMVFVFFLFEQPPLLFQRAELERIQAPQMQDRYAPVAERYEQAFQKRKRAVLALIEERHRTGQMAGVPLEQFRQAQKELDTARNAGARLVEESGGEKGFKDTNYIFLSFVTRYLPAGVVGLVIAVIFAAAMSSSSGEINSLATVTVIDIYRRHVYRAGTDRHYVLASRLATVFWGFYAITFAGFGKHLGSLIEAVNIIGSLFYGSLLGVFVLAFFFRGVRGTAAFWGMIAGEGAIFAAFLFTQISFLWYNVIGCAVVIGTALILTIISPAPYATPDRAQSSHPQQ